MGKYEHFQGFFVIKNCTSWWNFFSEWRTFCFVMVFPRNGAIPLKRRCSTFFSQSKNNSLFYKGFLFIKASVWKREHKNVRRLKFCARRDHETAILNSVYRIELNIELCKKNNTNEVLSLCNHLLNSWVMEKYDNSQGFSKQKTTRTRFWVFAITYWIHG